MAHRREQGFILPLAILLVVILAISGTSFMHHDFLERRMASNNSDNHSAFYLANAGLERARAVFKIGQVGTPPTPSWTPILNGSDPNYPPDPAPVFGPLRLCGSDPTSGCVQPPFGLLVNSGPPFDASFSAGQYEVRAFNNEPSTTDTDQRLTIRALGTVRGETKLLEATIYSISGLKMINCDEDANPGDPCPTVDNVVNPDPLPGREPASFPRAELPEVQPGFYENWGSFPASWDFATRHQEITAPPGGHNLSGILNRGHYLIHGDLNLNNIIVNDVVIFATGTIRVDGSFVGLRDPTGGGGGSILIGQNGIQVASGSSFRIEAPIPFPALVSGVGLVSSVGISVATTANIDGNIWSSGPINLNASTITGIIIGLDGPINLNVQILTDHQAPPEDFDYYEVMPGFNYPQGLSGNGVAPGSWRELE